MKFSLLFFALMLTVVSAKLKCVPVKNILEDPTSPDASALPNIQLLPVEEAEAEFIVSNNIYLNFCF